MSVYLVFSSVVAYRMKKVRAPLLGVLSHICVLFPPLDIISQASNLPVCESICSFCSRMKRGRMYACARREKYNVIAIGQHLDDIAERWVIYLSFLSREVICSLIGANAKKIGALRLVLRDLMM